MRDREHLRAQLEAIRAQAVAIVASIDALVGPPVEAECCDKPRLAITETYQTRTAQCGNCGMILSRVAIGSEEGRGESHG
jgi:Zn finger protein HypA/HybF involved in hydrogenase expression